MVLRVCELAIGWFWFLELRGSMEGWVRGRKLVAEGESDIQAFSWAECKVDLVSALGREL